MSKNKRIESMEELKLSSIDYLLRYRVPKKYFNLETIVSDSDLLNQCVFIKDNDDVYLIAAALSCYKGSYIDIHISNNILEDIQIEFCHDKNKIIENFSSKYYDISTNIENCILQVRASVESRGDCKKFIGSIKLDLFKSGISNSHKDYIDFFIKLYQDGDDTSLSPYRRYIIKKDFSCVYDSLGNNILSGKIHTGN